jgi:hypothetical protein
MVQVATNSITGKKLRKNVEAASATLEFSHIPVPQPNLIQQNPGTLAGITFPSLVLLEVFGSIYTSNLNLRTLIINLTLCPETRPNAKSDNVMHNYKATSWQKL